MLAWAPVVTMLAVPLGLCVAAVTVRTLPFASVSLARTLIVTGTPTIVVAASANATGAALTVTVTVPTAEPPRPSVAVERN